MNPTKEIVADTATKLQVEIAYFQNSQTQFNIDKHTECKPDASRVTLGKYLKITSLAEMEDFLRSGFTWSSGKFKGTRSEINLIRTRLFVIEFDYVEPGINDWRTVCGNTKAFAAIPSASYFTGKKYKNDSKPERNPGSYRLLFLADRDCNAVEFKAVVAELLEEYAEFDPDTSCSDGARFWYTPQGTEFLYTSEANIQNPLNVNEILAERINRLSAGVSDVSADDIDNLNQANISLASQYLIYQVSAPKEVVLKGSRHEALREIQMSLADLGYPELAIDLRQAVRGDSEDVRESERQVNDTEKYVEQRTNNGKPFKRKKKKPTEDEFDIHAVLPEYVKIFYDETEKATYYYWDLVDKYWKFSASLNPVVNFTIIPLMRQFGALEDASGLSKEGRNMLAHQLVNMDMYAIRTPLEQSTKYVGFANGCFDLQKKELVEHHPEQLNFSNYSFDFETQNDTVFNRIESFLKLWADNRQDDYQLVLDFFYASFLRLGSKWCRGLIIWGLTGSGKSTIFKSFEHIDSRISLELSEDAIRNDKHPFSAYNAAHQMVYIDDAKDLNHNDMGVLYSLLTENSKVPFTRKYANSLAIPRHSTFGCSSETMPIRTNNSKSGIVRRCFDVKVNWGQQKLEETEYSTGHTYFDELLGIFANTEIMRSFFMWSLMNVSGEEVLQRYRQFSNDKERQNTMKTEIAQDSVMAEFANEYLTVGQNSEHYILRSELLGVLKDYVRYSNDQYAGKLSDIMLMKHFLKDIRATHENGQQMAQIQSDNCNSRGELKQKSIDGKMVSVIWGITWKTEKPQQFGIQF
ncbi:MAG: hypothetical protein ACRDBG_27615 [Waterburya sp.]